MKTTTDRVRSHSSEEVIRRIDRQTHASLLDCAEGDGAGAVERIQALDREWDTDRVLETEAATMGLAGLALGILVRPVFLAIPVAVAANMLLHATAGRYPLMPMFRRLGFRTASEIMRERYAIKALRGDLSSMREAGSPGALADSAPPGI